MNPQIYAVTSLQCSYNNTGIFHKQAQSILHMHRLMNTDCLLSRYVRLHSLVGALPWRRTAPSGHHGLPSVLTVHSLHPSEVLSYPISQDEQVSVMISYLCVKQGVVDIQYNSFACSCTEKIRNSCGDLF